MSAQIVLPALRISELAQACLGIPYVYESENCILDGSVPRSVNCCLLVYWIFGQIGIAIPRDIEQQREHGCVVSGIETLQTGDVCFFATKKPHGHVALLVGEGEIVHACWRSGRVVAVPLRDLLDRYELTAIRRFF